MPFVVGEVNRSSNRIAVGLVIEALIIGSSFLLLADKGPAMLGMTIMGSPSLQSVAASG
jgi:ubiquinone biosynthesis protein